MLLSSSFHPQQAAPVAAGAMPSFTTNDGLWRDLDVPMSMTQPSLSRRTSRATAPIARPNSMRIVKPSQNGGGSLSSSPLHANAHMFAKPMLNRRQTVMGDSSSYRRRRLIEATAASSMAQALGQPQAQPQMRLRAGTTQTARPMSWHPVATNDGNMDMNWQTMSAYSSPMSMEYQMMAQQSQMGVPNYIQQQPAPILSTPNYSPIEQQQLQYAQNMYALSHAHPQPMNTFVPSQPVTPSLFPTQSFPMQESYAPYPYNNLVETNVTPQDWSLYNTLDVPSQFFSNVTSRTGSASTAPPTPESFPNYDAPKCLEQEKEWNIEVDDEDDSEVLVGMGLYDEPEKKGEDCVIEYGPVVSRFGREDKPQGKGLKLEETWEPPATEDDEEEGGEQDAEGEEEENVPEQQAVQSVNVPTAQQVQLLQQQQQMQMLYGFGQGQMPEQVAGWV